jgi:hypothetical protein
MWDDIFDETGQPTHMFWEVASHDDTTLLKPATTTCPTSQDFFHARIHDIPPFANVNDVVRITARTRIRPMSYEMLDELGIDPAIQDMMPTHELSGTQLEWTAAAADPLDNCVKPPPVPPITPVCP